MVLEQLSIAYIVTVFKVKAELSTISFVLIYGSQQSSNKK